MKNRVVKYMTRVFLQPMIVLELMPRGDLSSFLRNCHTYVLHDHIRLLLVNILAINIFVISTNDVYVFGYWSSIHT